MSRDYEAEAEARWEARQEYAEELAEQRRARKLHSCWCNLDGYPGHCPGPQNCPYSGYHDEDDEQ
jgi:hypothetical protein